MIYGQRSDLELKYAKARAKATEYSVAETSLPKFPLDSDDLHFPSVYALSQYADERLSGGDGKAFMEDLRKTASFYDAAANDGRNADIDDGCWTLAMATYFLLGNYGSAKVAASRIDDDAFYGGNAATLVQLVRYLFEPGEQVPARLEGLARFLEGFDVGADAAFSEARAFLTWDNAEDSFFGRLLNVAVADVLEYSGRRLLPVYTGLSDSVWAPYLGGRNSAKILWQAQRAMGVAGVFDGKGAFVQLPTGAGKTKSVELLVRARVLAGACNLAVVIAPLRALCSEISRELGVALRGVAEVKLASSVMELDDWIGSAVAACRVLVFTPEKFGYVLHHGGIFLEDIDLFVFDEAHLLDSASRGPSYELLLAEIVGKRPDAQKVLMSAVVANPQEIAGWVLRDSSGVVANGAMQVTEKSIAFALQDGRRMTYVDTDRATDEDFFLSVDIRAQELGLKPRERKKRVFPDLKAAATDTARDLAIYYANRLIGNGACAIYIPRIVSMVKFFSRLRDVDERGGNLSGLRGSFDASEIEAIFSLIALHYGEDNDLAGGRAVGVLPHYGKLQGAIRQSVEYAIVHGKAKCVACTSTLAEGVNLPIKYLMITGIRNGLADIRTRDFQNLIGRTARSGKYSEGSVLVVDNLKGGRRSQYARLVNGSNTEQCASAILGLLEDVNGPAGSGLYYSGAAIVDAIIMNLDDLSLEAGIAQVLESGLGLESSAAKREASRRIMALEAIESYMAGMLDDSDGLQDIARVCSLTFAYAVSSDNGRQQLLRLFEAVDESLRTRGARARRLCHVMQSGMRKPASLVEWLKGDNGVSFLSGGCGDFGLLMDGVLRVETSVGGAFGAEQLALIAELWVAGQSIPDIATSVNEKCPLLKFVGVRQVERVTSESIVFSIANFVSCIVDALNAFPEISPSPTAVGELEVLQRKLKYGVSNMRAAAICEEIVDDRLIAKQLVELIGAEGTSEIGGIRKELLVHRSEVESIFDGLPTFCKKRYGAWLKM